MHVFVTACINHLLNTNACASEYMYIYLQPFASTNDLSRNITLSSASTYIEPNVVNKALFQYPIRRLIVISRKISKPRDFYLELFDRIEIWQAPRQHCCRRVCQISKRCYDLNYQSCGFETSRDLTTRRLIRYSNGAQRAFWNPSTFHMWSEGTELTLTIDVFVDIWHQVRTAETSFTNRD